MRTIDCRDMPVPKPVVLAKSTLEDLPDDCAITFIVNCDMSEENILTYATNKGYFIRSNHEGAGTFITISKSFTCDINLINQKDKKIHDRILLITNDCIGHGLHGDELMQEFLDSLLLQKSLPAKIVFINQGVKLTCSKEDTQSVKTIKELESRGVKILVSTKSLGDLQLSQKNRVGEFISMYDLAQLLIVCNSSTI